MNEYDKLKYPTPDILKNKNQNASVLIICNGPSTKQIIKYKNELRDFFDVIIGVNHGFFEFEDVLDYHLVTEKASPTNNVPKMLSEKPYRKDLVRIINWKGLDKYPVGYNYYKTSRCAFDNNSNINSYKHKNGKSGLLTGKINNRNMATGSVALQALHLASIIGAKSVYFIGIDFIFKGEFDHFYNDNQYRDASEQAKLKEDNRIHIVDVERNGTMFKTTDYFRDSAETLDYMIDNVFLDIDIFDFSDGLIEKANKLNIDEFFKQNIG